MGKVRFGLSNVHLSKLTIDSTTGYPEYATPDALEGAVAFTLDAEGDQNIFYADNSQYAVFNTNNGFTGELEVADIPESIYTGYFNYVSNTVGTIEKADPTPVRFALIFQVETNDTTNPQTGFTFYDCTFGRPSIEANTTTDSTEPDTITIPINVSPIKTAVGTIVKSHKVGATSTYFTTAPTSPTV